MEILPLEYKEKGNRKREEVMEAVQQRFIPGIVGGLIRIRVTST